MMPLTGTSQQGKCTDLKAGHVPGAGGWREGTDAGGREACGGGGHAPSLITVVVAQLCALVKMDGLDT